MDTTITVSEETRNKLMKMKYSKNKDTVEDVIKTLMEKTDHNITKILGGARKHKAIEAEILEDLK